MVFCFVQKCFFGQHESQNINFFCRAKREIFFKNLILGYMTKILNQIYFFLHQNQNIFFSNIGNQNKCFEKNHNPPPLTLNGCSLSTWSGENFIGVGTIAFPISNFAKLLFSIFSVLNLLWTPVNCKCIDDTTLFFTLGSCVEYFVRQLCLLSASFL